MGLADEAEKSRARQAEHEARFRDPVHPDWVDELVLELHRAGVEPVPLYELIGNQRVSGGQPVQQVAYVAHGWRFQWDSMRGELHAEYDSAAVTTDGRLFTSAGDLVELSGWKYRKHLHYEGLQQDHAVSVRSPMTAGSESAMRKCAVQIVAQLQAGTVEPSTEVITVRRFL